jgi:hypothetical protein
MRSEGGEKRGRYSKKVIRVVGVKRGKTGGRDGRGERGGR